MREAPDARCWLHPEVEVRPSPIAGDGLFTRVDLAAGTVVSRLGGRLVDDATLQRLFASAVTYVDTVQLGGSLHLVLPTGNLNGKGNHSCDPNLWWVGRYELAARCDIPAGSELTNDYATSTANPDYVLACRCGSALCRGTVSGADRRLAELRSRYAGHWVPPLSYGEV